MPSWTVTSLALLALMLPASGRLTIDRSTVSFREFKSCPCPPAFYEPVNLRPPGYSTANPTSVETTFGTSPAVTIGLCALAVVAAIILALFLFQLAISMVRCCFWTLGRRGRDFNQGSKFWLFDETLPADKDYPEYADIVLI